MSPYYSSYLLKKLIFKWNMVKSFTHQGALMIQELWRGRLRARARELAEWPSSSAYSKGKKWTIIEKTSKQTKNWMSLCLNKGTPPWGGCGFSTIVYLVIESKITFLHCNLQYFMLVIYDVLTFAARCQNAKKKLLQFRNICLRFNAFFFSSVLFQSAFFVLKSLPKVWMYWCWCANLNCHDLT